MKIEIYLSSWNDTIKNLCLFLNPVIFWKVELKYKYLFHLGDTVCYWQSFKQIHSCTHSFSKKTIWNYAYICLWHCQGTEDVPDSEPSTADRYTSAEQPFWALVHAQLSLARSLWWSQYVSLSFLSFLFHNELWRKKIMKMLWLSIQRLYCLLMVVKSVVSTVPRILNQE